MQPYDRVSGQKTATESLTAGAFLYVVPIWISRARVRPLGRPEWRHSHGSAVMRPSLDRDTESARAHRRSDLHLDRPRAAARRHRPGLTLQEAARLKPCAVHCALQDLTGGACAVGQQDSSFERGPQRGLLPDRAAPLRSRRFRSRRATSMLRPCPITLSPTSTRRRPRCCMTKPSMP